MCATVVQVLKPRTVQLEAGVKYSLDWMVSHDDDLYMFLVEGTRSGTLTR